MSFREKGLGNSSSRRIAGVLKSGQLSAVSDQLSWESTSFLAESRMLTATRFLLQTLVAAVSSVVAETSVERPTGTFDAALFCQVKSFDAGGLDQMSA